MTTPQALTVHEPVSAPHQEAPERRPDLRVSGVTQLPIRRTRAFDLQGFCQAVERGDLVYQLARYAPDADVRIVDPDHPPSDPRILRGTSDILTWLVDFETCDLGVEITHLIDGGDRFAFTQQWRTVDGTAVVAVSTSELQDGLIAMQHIIVAWIRTWS